MTVVYLVRHAQAEGNLYRRCHGWYNSMITTAKGMRQIAALEARFRSIPVDAIYSSDLLRTMATAQAVCGPKRLFLHTDPQLREIHAGCWEDRPWGELLARDPDSLLGFWHSDCRWSAPGSETFPAVRNRITAAVERIAAAHPGQTVAIFTHGAAIRCALSRWLHLPEDKIGTVPHGDNTAVTRLEIENGHVKVCWLNDVSHLPAELAAPAGTQAAEEQSTALIAQRSLYFHPIADLTCSPVCASYHLEGYRAEGPGLEVLREGSAAGLLQTCQGGMVSVLYLAPRFRGQGLGVQLVGQAVSDVLAQGAAVLTLPCPAMPAARRYLEALGFLPVGGAADTLSLPIARPAAPDLR